ncbi:MAG: hypothetical protein SFY32_01275 [Bacteroidota bacterium]|nr:hypothetical protein [Bacteroidota bacterium]
MKKNAFYFLIIASFLCNAQSIDTENYTISITKVSASKNYPKIPWLKPGDKSWMQGNPTFTIKHESSELEAKGYIGMTDEALMFKIDVTDDKHLNDKELGDIWNGDAIQIGLDLEGQGSGNMPKDTPGMVGNDDAGIGFGLGKNGPEAFAWFLGGTFTSIPLDKKTVKIVRNEKLKTTNYEMSVSWKILKIQPGIYPTFGIAIQINDSDPDRKEQNRISWGKGAGGASTPGLFEKLAYSNPFKPIYASYKLNETIWAIGDVAEMCFVATDKNSNYLTISSEGKKVITTIMGSPLMENSTYSVQIKAKNIKKTIQVSGVLTDNNGNTLAQSQIITIIPELTAADFFRGIDSLIAVPDNHPLFLRHLQSVRALVAVEWGKSIVYKNNPRLYKETFDYIYKINEGLKGDAAKWESYLSNERTLTMSFISKRDNTLQFYSLDLPKNWNVTKKYALFFELHGSGNQNPIATLASQLSASATSLDLRGYTSVKSYSQQQGLGYHVAPFGRGNTGYRDIGEIDIFEAYSDAHKIFSIDEDQRYLYGFSMGGGGTWSVGLRTPDLWAAIGIFAGGVWREKATISLGKNLSTTPVFIWCGDKDGLFPNVEIMQNELTKYGIKPEVRITKGLDHKYPDSVQAIGIKWMTQFTRKRPNQFSFTADKDEHTGVWGISMNRDENVSGLPSFDCTIEGQTIKIDSKGTEGLKINLTDKGLKMSGIVKVIWNGKQEYEGDAKEITIGKFPGNSRF